MKIKMCWKVMRILHISSHILYDLYVGEETIINDNNWHASYHPKDGYYIYYSHGVVPETYGCASRPCIGNRSFHVSGRKNLLHLRCAIWTFVLNTVWNLQFSGFFGSRSLSSKSQSHIQLCPSTPFISSGVACSHHFVHAGICGSRALAERCPHAVDGTGKQSVGLGWCNCVGGWLGNWLR